MPLGRTRSLTPPAIGPRLVSREKHTNTDYYSSSRNGPDRTVGGRRRTPGCARISPFWRRLTCLRCSTYLRIRLRSSPAFDLAKTTICVAEFHSGRRFARRVVLCW